MFVLDLSPMDLISQNQQLASLSHDDGKSDFVCCHKTDKQMQIPRKLFKLKRAVVLFSQLRVTGKRKFLRNTKVSICFD